MRRLAVLAFLLISLAGSLSAQRRRTTPAAASQPSSGSGTLFELVSFEGGICVGYGLSPAGIGHGRQFAVSLALGSRSEVAYVRLSGDGASLATFNLLRLSLYTGRRTGFHLYSGADGYSGLAAGLAFFWDMYRADAVPRLKTALQLQLGYLYENGTGSPGAALVNLTLRFGY